MQKKNLNVFYIFDEKKKLNVSNLFRINLIKRNIINFMFQRILEITQLLHFYFL